MHPHQNKASNPKFGPLQLLQQVSDPKDIKFNPKKNVISILHALLNN